MTAGVRMLAYKPSQVQPGWIALIIVLLLVIATFLLWRNMNKQMRKIKVPPDSAFRDNRADVDANTGTDADPVDGSEPPAGI